MLNKIHTCLVFSACGLVMATAQTMNPSTGATAEPLASQAAREITETSSATEPLRPDAGFAAVSALTETAGPVADPNLNDMPALGEEGVPLVETAPGEEAPENWWRIRPIVGVGVVFDDNIFISNTNRKSDVIFNISGGLALEFGDYRNLQEDYLLLEYIGTGYFFSEYTEQNSFNQSASLLGQYRFNQLAVQVESTYQYLTGAERQVGDFTTRNLFYNALRFLYEYSEKTSFDLEFSQNSNIYDGFYNSSYYFQAQAGADYRIFPKVRLGLEGIVGFVTADNNPDMTYQTINARLKYDLSGKVALKATGGLQLTQYASGGQDTRATPVFSVGGEYLPFPNTSISLVAYRNQQVSPSINNQDFIATGVELAIAQTIAQRFQIGIAAGYENDDYVANTSSTTADRNDNYVFFRPNINYTFLKYLTASVFYTYRSNDSTILAETWYDNQVGFELTASF
jgi:hypothetical protein